MENLVLFLQKKIVPISNKRYRPRTTLNIYFEIYFTGRYSMHLKIPHDFRVFNVLIKAYICACRKESLCIYVSHNTTIEYRLQTSKVTCISHHL